MRWRGGGGEGRKDGRKGGRKVSEGGRSQIKEKETARQGRNERRGETRTWGGGAGIGVARASIWYRSGYFFTCLCTAESFVYPTLDTHCHRRCAAGSASPVASSTRAATRSTPCTATRNSTLRRSSSSTALSSLKLTTVMRGASSPIFAALTVVHSCVSLRRGRNCTFVSAAARYRP